MTTATPTTAEDAADAMADAGLIPVTDGRGATRIKPLPRDLAVSTAPDAPHMDLATAARGVHGLSLPPDPLPPRWGLSARPQDAAQSTLFAEEVARAEEFWRWLRDTRGECAQRAQRGYNYLSGVTRPEQEDIDLYRNLLHWVTWCESCLWLLTSWYAPHHAAPQPPALILPFIGLVNGEHAAVVVRELNGLPDRWLLEDALAWWHAWSLSTGYLARLEDDGEGDE
jgi:hypothetical protein